MVTRTIRSAPCAQIHTRLGSAGTLDGRVAVVRYLQAP
jgi:hypothetical protein